MEFYAKDKVIVITKEKIQNGRIAGRKGNNYKIEPRGRYFQPLSNNAKVFWANQDEDEIMLHRRFKDEQEIIRIQNTKASKSIIYKN